MEMCIPRIQPVKMPPLTADKESQIAPGQELGPSGSPRRGAWAEGGMLPHQGLAGAGWLVCPEYHAVVSLSQRPVHGP